MLYDIYFHDDFDGRASAAVMLSFLRSRGDDIERYVPVGYDTKPQWVKEDFFDKNKLIGGRKRNPVIVVDFLYHPKAAFWFDHHPTTFKKSAWQRSFKPSKFHHWETKYASCCHQVLDGLARDFGFKPPRRFRELARWLDIIDRANYKSAKQTIEAREPALRVREFIEEWPSSFKTDKRIVELLSQCSLASIARDVITKKIAALIRKKKAKSLQFYKDHLKVFGNLTFIDLSGADVLDLRFASYYLNPDAMYQIQLKKKGRLFHLGLGANPWRRHKNGIDIGGFLRRRYGGGGHKSVGGAEFETKEAAELAVHEIVGFLDKKTNLKWLNGAQKTF